MVLWIITNSGSLLFHNELATKTICQSINYFNLITISPCFAEKFTSRVSQGSDSEAEQADCMASRQAGG